MNDLKEFQTFMQKYKSSNFKISKGRYLRHILDMLDKYLRVLWINSVDDMYEYDSVSYIDFATHEITIRYRYLLNRSPGSHYLVCTFSDGACIEDVITKNAQMYPRYLESVNTLFKVIITPLNVGDRLLNEI